MSTLYTARNRKKSNAASSEERESLTLVLGALAFAAILFTAVTIIFWPTPAPAESSGYTGNITVVNKSVNKFGCDLMYVREGETTQKMWLADRDDAMCYLTEKGPATMKDGQLLGNKKL